MNGRPARFRAMIDAPGSHAGDPRPSPRMLDGSDGPVTLVFESGDGLRHVARLDRWLVIIRDQPTLRGVSRVVWLLDARTVHWSGTRPPVRLGGECAGLTAQRAPILWFRAGESADSRRSFTASGVFGAAGIVDAAHVRVRARWPRGRVRLRMSIDTVMWGLSSDSDLPDDTAQAGRLTVTASGALRPVASQALESWL